MSEEHKMGIEAYANQNLERSEELLSVAISNYKKNKIPDQHLKLEAMLALAKTKSHQWKFEEAKNLYTEVAENAKIIGRDSLYIYASMSVVSILQFEQKNTAAYNILIDLKQRKDLDSTTKSNIYSSIAGIKSDLEDYDSAKHYLQLAIAIDLQKNDSSSLPYNFYDLGYAYNNTYNYEKAIECFISGYNYLRSGKDQYKFPNFSIALGNVFYSIGNTEKAMSYVHENLGLAQDLNLQQAQTDIYNLMGLIYRYEKDYDKAIKYFIKSDSVNSSKIKNPYRSARAKFSIAHTKLDQNTPLSIEEKSDIDSLMNQDFDNPILQRMKLQYDLRTTPRSINSFNKKYNELELSFNNDALITAKITMLKIKKEFYEKNGLYKDALLVEEELKQALRSIQDRNNEYAVHELESKYRKAQQDSEILLLDAENQHKKRVLEQQQRVIIIGIISILIILILLAFLYRLFLKTKKQKEDIGKSLREKEILMKEIHHRVKNNLQLVSSLLSLQGRHVSDEVAREAIKNGQSRVRSMALIHQDLYQKEKLTDINAQDYLIKLSQELFTTYRNQGTEIKLNLDIDEIVLHIDRMVPLGLIINEALTNSLKHAFPNSEYGEISISLKQNDEHIMFRIEDNGIGISGSEKNKSFGMTLIRTLTEQIDGELLIDGIDGTHIAITFPTEEL